MTHISPTRWLRDKATEGLVELPGNAAWLIGKAFPDTQGSSGNGKSKSDDNGGSAVRTGVRKLRLAAADAVPFVPDSLEARIAQAQDAVAKARQCEEQAMQAAQDAKAVAEDASATAEEGARRLETARQERDEFVAQRVAEAQKRADEMVAQARAEAEREGDDEVARVQDDVDAAQRGGAGPRGRRTRRRPGRGRRCSGPHG